MSNNQTADKMKFYDYFKEKIPKGSKKKIFAALQILYGTKEDAVRNALKVLDKDLERLCIIARNVNTTGSSSIDELLKEINQPTKTQPKTQKTEKV